MSRRVGERPPPMTPSPRRMSVESQGTAMTRVKAKTSKPRPIGEWPEFDLGGVNPNEPEWKVMWDALAEASGDEDRTAEDPGSSEVWQYMCSFRFHGSEVWKHEFRHRCHPRKKERWVLHIEATPGWKYRKDHKARGDAPNHPDRSAGRRTS
jgi:hypothetical protein